MLLEFAVIRDQPASSWKRHLIPPQQRRGRWIAGACPPPSGSVTETRASSARTIEIRCFSCRQSMHFLSICEMGCSRAERGLVRPTRRHHRGNLTGKGHVLCKMGRRHPHNNGFANGHCWRKAAVRRHVRCWVNNGKHMLLARISEFDPERTSEVRPRNEKPRAMPGL